MYINIHPEVDYGYYIRGFVEENLQCFELAIYNYTQAIIINPECDSYYDARGQVKLLILDYDGAINDFEQAVHLNPENCDYIDNLNKAKLYKMNSKNLRNESINFYYDLLKIIYQLYYTNIVQEEGLYDDYENFIENIDEIYEKYYIGDNEYKLSVNKSNKLRQTFELIMKDYEEYLNSDESSEDLDDFIDNIALILEGLDIIKRAALKEMNKNC